MIEFTKDEISEEFMGLWNAFIDALPEDDRAAPDLSAIDGAVRAMAEYVGRIERQRARMRIFIRLFTDTQLDSVPTPMWRTVMGRMQEQAKAALEAREAVRT